jgi:hypothetical protein
MWHVEKFDDVTIHTFIIKNGTIEVVYDNIIDNVEVVMEIRSEKFSLDLYDYYPKAKQRDEIVKEVMGLLNEILQDSERN